MSGTDFRLIGAYDTEATTVTGEWGQKASFPILHTFGFIECELQNLTNPNQIICECVRNSRDAWEILDRVIEHWNTRDETPVIACHNLGFDFHALWPWLKMHDVEVTAKSETQPIRFTVLDGDGKPVLVIWDTLGFSGESLEKMGEEIKFSKLDCWDYEKKRTPETELTESEIAYAERDVQVLLMWLANWVRLNSWANAHDLGKSLLTKTGIVRKYRLARFGKVYGVGRKSPVLAQWLRRNATETPKSDEELMLMHASMVGGFSFVASRWASHPFICEDGECIAAFDATSQHPAQMASHTYPIDFEPSTPEMLICDMQIISNTAPQKVLSRWFNPFPIAFCACIQFTKLRPKPKTPFAKHGIYLFAKSGFNAAKHEINEDNQSANAQERIRFEKGFYNTVENGVFEFGKLKSADTCTMHLTELEYWLACQIYEWSEALPVFGYDTAKFKRPCDLCILSVMHFYDMKRKMKAKTAEQPENEDLQQEYETVKIRLNSLFGIECTNEAREDAKIGENGIIFDGGETVKDLPERPKAWYQFGARISGWSRISLCLAIMLAAPHAKAIINGDTDSLKILTTDVQAVGKELAKIGGAVRRSLPLVLAHIEETFPQFAKPLDGIGSYRLEFTTREFCAGWQKAYMYMLDNDAQIVLAGVDVQGEHSLRALAKKMIESYGFRYAASKIMAYDVCISAAISGATSVSRYPLGTMFEGFAMDANGNVAEVNEPMMPTISNTSLILNRLKSDAMRDFEIARKNNPSISAEMTLFDFDGEKFNEKGESEIYGRL